MKSSKPSIVFCHGLWADARLHKQLICVKYIIALDSL
jgi:hypothetical protein